jgi:hypothetical protein
MLNQAAPPGNTILLLDLYKSRGRALIQPYLYLGAFLDALHLPYTLYRWRNDRQELLERIERERVGHVFINLIMGPVLGYVEPVCRLLKSHFPGLTIWVGGIGVQSVRDLLEGCPDIDRVSAGNPCADPDGFARELFQAGLLAEQPPHFTRFPSLLIIKNLPVFLHEHQRGEGFIRAANLSTASGCPNACSFCYLANTRPWAHPLDALLEDLTGLQECHAVRYFEFSDDNFPADRDRLAGFCRRIKSSGLDFSFFCLSSLDVLDAQVLDQMCACGLKRLYIGVDGINTHQIGQLNKPYPAAAVPAKMDLVRTYPLDLTLAVVLGSPGENRRQIQDLYDWAAEVGPEFCEASFLTPYPGTAAYRRALALGFNPPTCLGDWAVLASLQIPKSFYNPQIGADEYLNWANRFQALGTHRFRSGIGESARRLSPAERPADSSAGGESADMEAAA